MATHKVIQDIEAEDKFLGPLTLKQFIYACITALCLYLSFLIVSRGAWPVSLVFLPFIIVFGFLAWPWGRDQPTEVWLLARIRFFFKPRRRIWDQDGIQNLVTITVPKAVERYLTDGLSEKEVHSRLKALANTLDSRGWAVKNVHVNLYAEPAYAVGSSTDRLIDLSDTPQEVPSYDVTASDDILDSDNNPVAQQLDQLVNASTKAHREEALEKIRQARSNQQTKTDDYWFMANAPTPQPGYAAFDSQVVTPQDQPLSAAPAAPTADEQAILDKLHAQAAQPAATGNMHTIQPASGQAADPAAPATAGAPQDQGASPAVADPAILKLANNDDLNVATIAREAQRSKGQKGDDEVVISLH